MFVDKEPGEYAYLSMSEDPPDGVLRRGQPPYERMGREVSFENLPEECRRLVLETYRELWGLREGEDRRRFLSSPAETGRA